MKQSVIPFFIRSGMLFLVLAIAVFVGAAGKISAQAKAESSSLGLVAETEDASAFVIPIKGNIEPGLAAFIRSETRKALADGADFLIFEIDTFGGRVDTALQISAFIGSVKGVKTIAWIRGGPESMGVSWSAGALIALSCSSIYMANGTSIGAAAPVTIGVDGKSESAGEKSISAVRSQMAAIAEKNGHPVAIAYAMVDADVELWEIELAGKTGVASAAEAERLEKERPTDFRRIQLVSAKGKLLSLTAGESVRYGLAAGTADDLPVLLGMIGASGEAVELTPSPADSFVAFLTSAPVQTILILIGLVALFLEINTPGFGIPGAIALVSFLGVFGANALLGSVGSLELILFLLGLGLLAVEIFVLPGFGITGVSGLVLIAVSLIFSMQDFVFPESSWQWDLLGRNALVVSIGLIAAIAGIAALALAGPRLRMFDRLTLKTVIRGTAGGPDVPDGTVPADTAEKEAAPYASLLGKTGKALSVLRPVGKGEIEGTVLSVEADGEFLEAGTPIEVYRVRGNRIMVRTAADRGEKV